MISLLLELLVRWEELLDDPKWANPTIHDEVVKCRELLRVSREKVVRLHMLLVLVRMSEIVAHAPGWLRLTPEERRQIAKRVTRALDEDPDATWCELLWCVAVDAVRPRTRGKKPIWLGIHGTVFVAEVNVVLESRGLERSKRKGLAQAINLVRTGSMARYGRYSEERLRKAYYDALPRYLASPWMQSGKSAE